MKNWVVFIFTLVIVLACSNERLSRSEAVTKYYNGFDIGNFNEIKSVLGDSITLSSGVKKGDPKRSKRAPYKRKEERKKVPTLDQ